MDIIKTIRIESSEVEIVDCFKLLGCQIDHKLLFEEHYQHVKKLVNIKCFAIKDIFYLSQTVRAHFFKAFIQPHFDYCASLYIYFSESLLKRFERFYDICIYRMLKIKLFDLDVDEQLAELSERGLMPFRVRYFYRLSIFSYKVLNKQILKQIQGKLVFTVNQTMSKLRSRKPEIIEVPGHDLNAGSRRLSIFLPRFVNLIIRDSFKLTFNEFKNMLLSKMNLLKNFKEFSKYF